ncbi:MAG: 4-hydroxybenzoate octaprenyltransferase [Henriciella sp.]|nr:4-hydroxybenzoate octaprenyltransferase [Henriciella sp.]
MTQQTDSEETLETDVEPTPTPDSALPEWLKSLPAQSRPYASLARLDRPVGIWLLFLPCVMGLALMRIPDGLRWIDLGWLILFAIGAVAMRGAGCTWNDITDRDTDAQVERTKSRPLPSGQVTLNQAYMFLAAQLTVGFLVWLLLPFVAKIVALMAIPLVLAYPYMKRITWWPQAWLGFTFNWGVLVAGATVYGSVTGASVVLYLGLVFWTVAYDTTYALQDVEDDALAGVKSTARLFGDKVLTGIFTFHIAATAWIAASAYFAGAGRIGAVIGLAFFAHGFWQISKLSHNKTENALSVFKSNVWAGGIVAVGLLIAALI